MKRLTFAVGLAAGYVLGTRAGHEKYQQIVQGAKNVTEHPTVVQAQTKLKDAVGTAKDAAASKLKLDSGTSAPAYVEPDATASYRSSATEGGY